MDRPLPEQASRPRPGGSGQAGKTLLLTVAAANAIAQTGTSAVDQGVALPVFIAVGTIGVGAPVAIYHLKGERAAKILSSAHDWMAREKATIMAVLCLIIGAKLLGDAIAALAASSQTNQI